METPTKNIMEDRTNFMYIRKRNTHTVMKKIE